MKTFVKNGQFVFYDESERFTDRYGAERHACDVMQGELEMQHDKLKAVKCGHMRGGKGKYVPFVAMEKPIPWLPLVGVGFTLGAVITGTIAFIFKRKAK